MTRAKKVSRKTKKPFVPNTRSNPWKRAGKTVDAALRSYRREQAWVARTINVVKQAATDALEAAAKGLEMLKTFSKKPAKALCQMRLLFAALADPKLANGQVPFLSAKVLAKTQIYRENLRSIVESAEWKKFSQRLRPVLDVMNEEVSRQKNERRRSARIVGKHSSNRCMCESPEECLWRSKEEILGTDEKTAKAKAKAKRRK